MFHRPLPPSPRLTLEIYVVVWHCVPFYVKLVQ